MSSDASIRAQGKSLRVSHLSNEVRHSLALLTHFFRLVSMYILRALCVHEALLHIAV